MKKQGFIHAFVVVLIQIALTLAAAALLSMTEWLSPLISDICLWGVYPILGAATAYLATVNGVNNYLAWPAPPLMLVGGHWLVWSYLPPAGPMFVSALLGIVGAATGETKKRFDGRRRR